MLLLCVFEISLTLPHRVVSPGFPTRVVLSQRQILPKALELVVRLVAINRSNGPSGLFLGGWGLNKFFFQKMQLVLYHRNSDQSTGWSPIVETV